MKSKFLMLLLLLSSISSSNKILAQCMSPGFLNLASVTLGANNEASVEITFTNGETGHYEVAYATPGFSNQQSSGSVTGDNTDFGVYPGPTRVTLKLQAGKDYEIAARWVCSYDWSWSNFSSILRVSTYQNYPLEVTVNGEVIACVANSNSCLDCPGIGAITVTNLTTSNPTLSSSATLQWPVVVKPNSPALYILRLKKDGGDWREVGRTGRFCSNGTVSINLTDLSPNTKYSYQILHVCDLYNLGVIQNKKCDISQTSNYSPEATFTTPPLATGACGCVSGDWRAPVIQNSGYTVFWCGTITDASPITQTSAALTFKSQLAYFNPGFVTTVSGTGVFQATVFDPSSCAVSSSAAKAIRGKTVITAEDKAGNNVRVYPNPATDKVNIQVLNKGEVVKSILFTDVQGRSITISGSNTINISHLVSGIYFYTIQTNLKTYKGKIVKQ